MGKSSHSEVLGVQCRKALIAKITGRADALGISKSRFAALILERWEAEGGKPVNNADRALSVLRGVYPVSLNKTSDTTESIMKSTKPSTKVTSLKKHLNDVGKPAPVVKPKPAKKPNPQKISPTRALKKAERAEKHDGDIDAQKAYDRGMRDGVNSILAGPRNTPKA